MDERDIDALLAKDLNDLFVDLALADPEATAEVRAAPSRKELIRAGSRRFDAMRSALREALCRKEVLARVAASSSERELVSILADTVMAAFTGVPIPVFTVAGLVAKIGIVRFCRERQVGSKTEGR